MPPPLYSTKDPDVKNSDVHVKNKFKWAWMDESVEYIDDQKITQTVLLLLLSTHSSLIIGGSPLLLSDGGSPPASPASHLAGLLRRRDPSTNPGPIAWWVSVGN